MERAFPRHLLADVRSVLEVLPAPSLPTSPDTIGPVVLAGEHVEIPVRVYLPENEGDLARLTPRQALIRHCIYSRHHDGHVRERALRRLIDHRELWVVPFVIQLVAEYVVEVIQVIEKALTDEHAETYVRFLNDNGPILALTRQRVVSYWQCYYRYEFPQRDQYPGFRVLARFESWRDKLAQQGP